MSEEHYNGGIVISTDRERLDVDAIHSYLSNESYWAAGIPREIVERSIRHSLCFGVYDEQKQIGFARVISDFATYAYLCDLYILEPYRGRGLSKRLVEQIIAHPDLQGLRRFCLGTRDAHGLYTRYGFLPQAVPANNLERRNQDVYRKMEP